MPGLKTVKEKSQGRASICSQVSYSRGPYKSLQDWEFYIKQNGKPFRVSENNY